MDPLSFQERNYETVRAERDELRAEVEKVNGFREDLRRKFNVRGDRLNEALAHIESLRAKLATAEAQRNDLEWHIAAKDKCISENLARLEEARWLMSMSDLPSSKSNSPIKHEWYTRRDAWLSGHTASERLGKEAK